MTDFWLVAMAIAAVAGLWIAFPFLGRRTIETNAAEGAISIYRDQMDEVERDTAAGLISNEEGEAARAEIERRALKAARSLDGGLAISKRAPIIALLLTVVAGGAALGVYGAIGSPNAPDQPLAERRAEALERQAEAGDLGSKIQILIDRTKENPESFEDWWMLARSYSAVGDNASAADAYRNAVELSDDRPSVLSAYAEAMTLANGNKVPSAAKVIFQQLAVENADPRARYYVALAKAQEQDFEGAIQGWAELNRDSEPNAPWVAVVRRDIVNMARFLKTDVATYLPDATPDELAAAGGPGLLPESGTTDLAALEARTASDPKDYEAWIELANARAANGDSDGAAADIAEAKRQFAGAPFLLSKFNELERRLGLDLVALDAGPKGPTTEDMAAAAEMTQEDRDDMIAGMVAGLAARLDEQPNDPEGWAMLIRSYQTLGDAERAETALERATELFKGTEAYQVILDTR